MSPITTATSASTEPPPHPTPYCLPQYQLVPEIYVSSLERSVNFYTCLGFTVDWSIPPIFAQLSWHDCGDNNGCLLFLKQKQKHAETAAGQSKTKKNDGEMPGNIRIMVPDVDAKYRECAEMLELEGIGEVVQEIDDRRFVLRDFIVRDPDGFGVRFGSFLVGRGRMEQRGPVDRDVVVGGLG